MNGELKHWLEDIKEIGVSVVVLFILLGMLTGFIPSPITENNVLLKANAKELEIIRLERKQGNILLYRICVLTARQANVDPVECLKP